MKLLMCAPEYYDVCYEINPWMHRIQGVEGALARRQWRTLRRLILDRGAEVLTIDQVRGMPDMVFTANAGLVHENKVWLSHFRFPERQGEYEHFKAWFSRNGFEIHGERPEEFLPGSASGTAGLYRGPRFEGAGDALFLGSLLFAGHGFRSDRAYYERLGDAGIENIVYCRLVDPYFYHLDTCFCPLNTHQALWWPPAFAEDSRARMGAAADLIPVSEAEAKRFACNAVVLGNHVIMPSGCPETRNRLGALGFAVDECDMSEFIKAGGACKCLSLSLSPPEGVSRSS